MLIAHGADVNHVSEESGSTALYSAAAFGKTGVVKVLLAHGANPNLCGKHKSPLQAALENGFSEAAAAIQAAGGRKTREAS